MAVPLQFPPLHSPIGPSLGPTGPAGWEKRAPAAAQPEQWAAIQAVPFMQDRLSWAQSACARVMRPLVRLALGMGLKHPHMETMLRDLLLEEATRLWQRQGVQSPNISQLAVTT